MEFKEEDEVYTVHHGSIDGGISQTSSEFEAAESRIKFRHQDHQGRFKHNETYLDMINTTSAPKPIDLVITYRQSSGKLRTLNGVIDNLLTRIYRERFEKALVHQGITISRTMDTSSGTNALVVLKLHATDEFMLSRADSSDLKAPIQPLHTETVVRSMSHATFDKILKPGGKHNPFSLRNDTQKMYGDPHINFISAPYSAKQKDLFISDKVSRLFTTIQRISLVWDCVSQTRIKFVPEGAVEAKFMDKVYDNSAADLGHPDVSFQWFLNKKIYTAAFPLHDHNYKPSKSMLKSLAPKQWPLRPWLHDFWVKTPFKVQPLNAIRAYFGEATAIYFSFLGFYTGWLFFAVVLGIITYCYGFIEAYGGIPRTAPILCSSNVSNMTCRACRAEFCSYLSLEAECPQKILQLTFEHRLTIVYAFLISLWAVLFIEFWQRRQYELAERWEVSVAKQQYDLNTVRADFLSSTFIEYRKNAATGEAEFFIPKKKLVIRRAAAALITLFFLAIQIGIMYGIIKYRETILIRFKVMAQGGNTAIMKITPHGMTSITSALLNAVCIYIMQLIWIRIVKDLVDLELQETTAAYENSYTYKMYFFQFVNYYGVLFYLALVKGKSVNPPNEASITTDSGCGPGGCLLEVCIQVAILMSVKQLFTHCAELVFPWFKIKLLTLYEVIINTVMSRINRNKNNTDKRVPLWKRDWLLISTPTELLHYDDYLNIAIEFGFITIFTSSFPLAPLLALINNLFKIRVDGSKYLTLCRRPIPIPRGDIGPWIRILRVIVDVAILINAFVIAFTTNIVDYIVYTIRYAPKGVSYEAMIYNVFDTQKYVGESFNLRYIPEEVVNTGNMSLLVKNVLVPNCLYSGRYLFHVKDDLINPLVNRYFVLVWRLIFVIVFFVMVMFIKTIIIMMIPEIPKDAVERDERAQKFISDLQLKRMENSRCLGKPDLVNGQDRGARRSSKSNRRKSIPAHIIMNSVERDNHGLKGLLKNQVVKRLKRGAAKGVKPNVAEFDESTV